MNTEQYLFNGDREQMNSTEKKETKRQTSYKIPSRAQGGKIYKNTKRMKNSQHRKPKLHIIIYPNRIKSADIEKKYKFKMSQQKNNGNMVVARIALKHPQMVNTIHNILHMENSV